MPPRPNDVGFFRQKWVSHAVIRQGRSR